MKIFPRQISIEAGKDEYELNIRNSATDDRILLFKIRRSEHKIVEFSPKVGYVVAGQTVKITLKTVPHTVHKTRLLVKLVVLKRALLDDDFEHSWSIASKRNGEVKKVIDIIDSEVNNTSQQQDQQQQHDSEWDASSPPTHKPHATKPEQGQSLRRVLSTDSDGVSEISMQHSMYSSAFYPPTPSVCSPDQPQHTARHTSIRAHVDLISQNIHAERSEREGESATDGAAGSVIEFDQYSVAATLLEDSVELHSFSQSLSQSQQLQLQRATEDILAGRPHQHQSLRATAPNHNTINNQTPSHGVNHPVSTLSTADSAAGLLGDPQNVLAVLLKLAQSPATSTLLSQLLVSGQVHQPSAGIAPSMHMSGVMSGVVGPEARSASDVSYYDTHAASAAERTRRYIYAEDDTFPSVRNSNNGFDEGKQEEEKGPDPALCSRLTSIPSAARRGNNSSDPDSSPVAAKDARESCLLELSGDKITNKSLGAVAELRLEEATASKHKVVAIEIAEAAITSLGASIGMVFAQEENATSGDLGSQSGLKNQLNELRAAFLEDNLKHLSVNGCMLLASVDTSVNRFLSLKTLNLSGNRIRSIGGPLDLPLLRSLDLSHNSLTSLDFLQLLTSLSSLQASHNRIASLGLSINMLVAHSKSLVSLDLSSNPVCEDQHYAQEVIHVLPRLRFFDSVDLDSASQAYSHRATRAQSTERGPGSSSGYGQQSTPQRGHKGDRRLPDLPDEVRSVRSSGSVTGGNGRMSYADKKKDFERRVYVALGQRRKLAVSSPNPRQVDKQSPAVPARSGSRTRGGGGGQYSVTSTAPRLPPPQSLDYGAFSDDEDLEMRSVQDSIQQLDSSMRSRGSAAPSQKSTQHQHQGQQGRYGRADQRESVDDADGRRSADSAAGRNESKTFAHEEGDEAGYFAHTAAHSSKRRVDAPSLIQHWAGHRTTEMTTVGLDVTGVPEINPNSTLLDPTQSIRNRATYYGTISGSQRFPTHPVNASRSRLYSSFSLGESYRGASAGRHSARHRQQDVTNNESRGYHSEGELGSSRRSARKAATVVSHTEQEFMEMQESERYGAWHPRYRVPKPVFGFSKPFAHRHAPSLKDHAPLFDTTVQRLRDSFRRDPGRGTFGRAGKGLPGEWYPMDYSDVEAIRRQGYFHETIGDVAKDSYRDTASAQQAQLKASVSASFAAGALDQSQLTHNTHTTSNTQATQGAKFLQEALVSPKGSVSLSPQKAGRRQSWGPHMSRYDRTTSVVHAYDDFSGFRKWHQGLFDETREGGLGSGGHGHGVSGLQSFSVDGMDNRSAFSLDTHHHLHLPAQQRSTELHLGNQDISPPSTSSPHFGEQQHSAFSANPEMAAYFAEEEEALAAHKKQTSEASQRVQQTASEDSAAWTRQDERPNKDSLSRYDRDRDREDNYPQRQESTSLGLPSLPLGLPTASQEVTGYGASEKQRHPPAQQQKQGKALTDQRNSSSVSRSVTLLPMERQDSGEFQYALPDVDMPPLPQQASSPIQAAAFSSPSHQGDESFREEMRVFDLPPFPSMTEKPTFPVQLHVHVDTAAIERSAEKDGEVFVDIEHRIEAEEEALSNYLSWLENQHSGGTPRGSISAPPSLPTATVTTATAEPTRVTKADGATTPTSSGGSNIPRYNGSASKGGDSDKAGGRAKPRARESADASSGLKVFSPRDAAMRAEQSAAAEPEDSILFSNDYKNTAVNPLRKLFR